MSCLKKKHCGSVAKRQISVPSLVLLTGCCKICCIRRRRTLTGRTWWQNSWRRDPLELVGIVPGKNAQYGSKWSYWWGSESWNLIPEGTQSSHHLMYSWRFTGAFWSSEANVSLFTATYRKWGIVLDSSCNNSSTWVNSRLPPISAKTTVKGGLQPARILKSWWALIVSFLPSVQVTVRYDHPEYPIQNPPHQSQPKWIWELHQYLVH